jgi:hypothetical protein
MRMDLFLFQDICIAWVYHGIALIIGWPLLTGPCKMTAHRLAKATVARTASRQGVLPGLTAQLRIRL